MFVFLFMFKDTIVDFLKLWSLILPETWAENSHPQEAV